MSIISSLCTCSNPVSSKDTPKGPLDVKCISYYLWNYSQYIDAAYESCSKPYHVLSGKINDISSLSIFRNVENIDFSQLVYDPAPQISDFSVLSNFTKTINLSIDSKYLTDISWIANMPNLTTLWLSDGNISSFSNLSGLSKLRYLFLWGIPNVDFSWATSSIKLDSLSLSVINSGLNIKNIENISTLLKLTILDSYFPNVLSFNNFAHLLCLSIENHGKPYNTTIFDYSSLSNCHNLNSLDLYDINITNLSFLKDLQGITYLSLQLTTSLMDISAISNLTNIKCIRLSGSNPNLDFTPLLNCLGQADTLFSGGLVPSTIMDTLTNKGVLVL
jgi:hypothetical protein